MLINAIEGIVENGLIRLREKVLLPEHSKVYVIVADEQVEGLVGLDDRSADIRSPRLAHPEQSKDFRKEVVELATDAQL
jgi:predicted DNA-binding antitoxin AbrB/MazE fold protein